MATATHHDAVTEVVSPEKVVLEMSMDEAQFVADILSAVAGDPFVTRRSHQSGLSQALRGAGITYRRYQDRDWSGGLRFR